MYTISQLESFTTGKIGGSSISDVADFNTSLWLSALRVKAKLDLKGMKRSATLSSPLYDNITKYALPSDFGTAIDLLPQVGREGSPGVSDFTPRFSRQFSLRGELNSMAIDSIDGIEYLLARRNPSGNIVTISEFENLTTWVASNDAGTPYRENLNYVAGSGALAFDASGVQGYSTLTATIPAQNFSEWNLRDSAFLWIYVSDVTHLTRITLSRGSSPTNYYEFSITTQHDGTAFRNGWNLLRFTFLNFSGRTGTPNLASTTYFAINVEIDIGYPITGIILDSLTDQLGDYYQMQYYSRYCFSTPAGTWIETPIDDTTIINFDTDAITILSYELLDDLNIELAKKGGRNSAYGEMDRKYASVLGAVGKGGLYDEYARKYPSERVTAQQVMYDFDL